MMLFLVKACCEGRADLCEPLIAVEPTGDEPVELDGYDWLIVTSVTGAEELKRRARGRIALKNALHIFS